MINKIKEIFSITKFILNSSKFKSIFSIIICTCILNLFTMESGIKYEEAIFSSITNTLFLIIVIGILFVSSCFTLNFFDKEYSLILRLENKIKYLKTLLLSITIINMIIFCFAIALSILLLTFKYFGIISFGKISNYNMSYAIYNIFTFIKYFTVIDILSLLGICMYKCLGKISCCIYYLLVLMLYYTYPVSADIISSFNLKNLFFGYYIYPYQYASFHLELTSSVIFVCIMMLIMLLFIYIIPKYSKIKIDE